MARGYDILGNVAVVKFSNDDNTKDKKKFAEKFLEEHNAVRSVLEKVGKFSGRLRTLDTKHVAGEKTKEVLYKENGCQFRFNVDTCYFSPRLATERKEIARMVKKNEEVLVLFGGVAPFAIVVSKLKNPKRVVSVELGRDCSKYAKQNVKRNKVDVEVIQGDVRKVLPNMSDKFDRIIMARPNLEDNFLDVTFSRIKKGGRIHYYGFYDEENLDDLKKLIKEEAEKASRKIRITKVKKAGEIGVRKYRYRVDFIVKN